MITRIIENIPISSKGEFFAPEGHPLFDAVNAIKSGSLVAFPTETVYGLGANALDPDAVKKIFDVKGRPSDNPLIIHVSSAKQILQLVRDIPDCAQKLINRFMPGPITLVFRKSDIVPDIVTAGLDTVAVRIPSHPIARLFLELAQIPVAAPSANISGTPSPTESAHVINDFFGKIPFVIDGGESIFGLESTVVDVTGIIPVVLRPGTVTAEDIFDCCGYVSGIGSQYADNSGYSNAISSETPEAPKAPGIKYKHYSPKALVVIPADSNIEEKNSGIYNLLKKYSAVGKRVGIFANMDIIERLHKTGIEFFGYSYGEEGDVRSASASLFRALRKMDDRGIEVIIAETYPAKGIGTAYMNRLLKASAPELNIDFNKSKVKICKVLFICSGNTCRSPMAEFYFNNKAESDPSIECKATSAGISTVNGLSATEEAISSMKELFDIDISDHRSTRLHESMLKGADIVLAMQRSHKEHLINMYPEFATKVFTLSEYARDTSTDVPDPYGQGFDKYDQTANQIACLIDKIIERIKTAN